MQLKSSRGVQQDDVWAAADTLIGEGLRPTIERVRQKIGRGSPNTVSPMLEAWFATLAPRLGVSNDTNPTAVGALPEPVRQAALKLWEIALTASQQEAANKIELEKETLAQERTALTIREVELLNQQRVLKEWQVASDEALKSARLQYADLCARLDLVSSQLVNREAQVQELRKKLDEINMQRDNERRHNEDQAQHHAQERSRLAEQSAADQRRLLFELDRARQQAKRAETAAEKSQTDARQSITELETANGVLSRKLGEAESELRSALMALSAANDRAIELRGLLKEESVSTAAALKQINRLASVKGRRQPKVTLTSAKIRSPRRAV
jgi:hypothetical protein